MNIVALQKQLQGLPDQALAAYMQKPSMEVPQYLVLGELQRRQKLRQSAAATQAPQQAPRSTVAEDVMGGGMMALPQEPAPEGYASGGLVSFAGGGEVDNDPYAAYKQRARIAAPVIDPMAAARAGASMAYAQGASPFASDVSGLIGRHAQPVDYSGGEAPQLEPYNAQPLVAPGFAERAAALAAQNAPQAATPVIPTAPQGGLGSLAMSARSKTPGVGVKGGAAPDDTQYKPISIDQRLSEIDKLDKYFSDKNKGEFDEDKARLAEERQALEARKGDNVNQALIQAGLGMMAGKSQYALQNIGEGGMQGLAYLQKAQASDDQTRRWLASEQNALSRAQSAARRGDQQSAVQFQGMAEKDRQFAVTAAQQRENYLLAHQDRMAQINATLQAASMRVSAGGGTKQDALALKAAQMAEGSAKNWLMANKSNPEYVINPGKLEQDYQAKLSEGYTRAYAVISREVPGAVTEQTAQPQKPTISFGSLK